jgi:tRNA A-37 threonylcarbamoyl transferase component Bud32
MWIIAAGLSLVGLTLALREWTMSRLGERLRIAAIERLSNTLEVRASNLRIWANRQKDRAQRAIQDPEFAGRVAALVKIAESEEKPADALRSSPSYGPSAQAMRQAPPEINDRGWTIISPRGVGICVETDGLVGAQVAPSAGGPFRRVLLGEWLVSKPYPHRQHILGMNADASQPIHFVAGPIYSAQRQIVAVAHFRFSTEAEFTNLIASAPAAAAPELLVFDDKGLVLNDLRDAADLRRLGLLPEQQVTRTALSLTLRDPGADLAQGLRPAEPAEAWPLTRLAQAAISRGGNGSDASGYRNHRGHPVLGAWAWLPDFEMGIAMETGLDTVLQPSKPVAASFNVILGGVALLTLAGAALSGFYPFSLRQESNAFGSYVLDRKIGKGGMAEVFLAHQRFLKRPSAVKILQNPLNDPKVVARFEREARLAGKLGHPSVIQVFDYGTTPDGRFYFAMEYVDGLNLAQLLTLESPLPVARAIHLLKQIAEVLEEAHQLGIVHRDIKPSNIMVCRRGAYGDVVKILDFGIACSTLEGDSDRTQSGQITGTPIFIAPERLRSPQTADHRSDLYSLGAVAFHLLTGRNLFEGSGLTELLYQALTAERPSPSRLRGEALPASLEKLILDCVAADPGARPADAGEILRILNSIRTEESWSPEQARAWWQDNQERILRFVSLAAAADSKSA